MTMIEKLNTLVAKWEAYVRDQPDQGEDYKGYYAGHDACAFQLRGVLNEHVATLADETLRDTEWHIATAERDADDVSSQIEAGKRVNRGRTEDLRNHVRFLAAELRKALAQPSPEGRQAEEVEKQSFDMVSEATLRELLGTEPDEVLEQVIYTHDGCWCWARPGTWRWEQGEDLSIPAALSPEPAT